MKILLLANGTLSVAHQELTIAAALKEAGHHIQIVHDVNFGIFNKGLIPDPLEENDIISQQHGNFEELRIREEPDIIFGLDQSVAPFVLEAKKHSKKPALCMFLDFPVHVIDEGSAADFNPDYSQRYYYFYKCGLALDNIVFNNKVAYDEVFRRDNRKTELVKYPLCNLKYIDKISKEVDVENPYVSSCHRFVSYKGTEYLVKALYGVDVNYKAISVGGNISAQVEADARSKLRDRFIFLPKLEEKIKLKTIADAMLFCYPQVTDWVGGLSPLEAMALKTPVVCFDYPVLRELYEDCIIWAKPKDIDDLQEKILSVLNDDYDTDILEKAHKRVYEEFTPSAMAENLTKVFEKYL